MRKELLQKYSISKDGSTPSSPSRATMYSPKKYDVEDDDDDEEEDLRK